MHCFAILLALGLTWTGLPAGWAQDDPADEVTVPDAALRAVLEDSLGLSAGAPITEAVLAELTVLEAPDAGIVDLTGLEHATGLTRLHLGPRPEQLPWSNSNDVSDLSPLSGLTGLTWLHLAGNSVADVTPLSGLTGLTFLNLQVNEVADVSSLSGLTDLADLYLAFNPLRDASSLSGLTGLSVHDLPRPLQYPELGSSLNSRVEGYQASSPGGQSAVRGQGGQGATPTVPVRIRTNSRDSVETVARFLQGRGIASNTWRSEGGDGVQGLLWARVPVSLLVLLSEQPGVIRVREVLEAIPQQGQSQGSSSTTASSAHGATAWRIAGIRGDGIKVGVLDIGFHGFGDLMEVLEELNPSYHTYCYADEADTVADSTGLGDCGDDPHGTDVTRALLDIAPNVELYIARAHKMGPSQRTRALDWMIRHGVQVINFSVNEAWDGPGDGTSTDVASPLKLVDTAVDSGIVWVNAAGNDAQRTWYSDSPAFDTMGYLVLPGTPPVRLPLALTGEAHEFQLRWKDEWTNPAINLDLYLYHNVSETGMRLAWSSTDPQPGPGAVPMEILIDDVSPFYGPSRDHWLSVRRLSGSGPGWVQLQEYSGYSDAWEDASLTGSIGNPAESDKAGMLAVGASDLSDPPVIQASSARGPVPELEGRAKPDLVAIGVLGTQTGTSIAAPRVAGLAALVIQELGDIYTTPAQVAQYLRDNADDRGSTGADNTWGHGLAKLPPPPAAPKGGTAHSSAQGIEVQWGKVAAAVGYRLEFQRQLIKGTAGWSEYARLATLTDTSFTHAPSTERHPLDLKYRYRYRVRARPAGAWSTDIPVGPSAPQNFKAVAGDGQVLLTWQAPASTGGSPLLGYHYRESGGGRTTGWIEFQKTWTRYLPQNLRNGQAYTFEVRAYTGAAAGASVDTTVTPAGAPLTPGGFTAAPGAGQVALRWTAADSNGAWITAYEVRHAPKSSPGAEVDWTAVDWTAVPGDSTARDTTITGLSNGTRYVFQVAARNRVGLGTPAEKETTPQGNRPPVITAPDTVWFAEHRTDSVATLSATDPEDDAVTWSHTGADVGFFEVRGDTLFFKMTPAFTSPDFEAPADADEDNYYQVTLTATDAGDPAASASHDMTVAVTNAPEAGRVTLSTTQPRVGMHLTATLTDPDQGVTNDRWSWEELGGASSAGQRTRAPAQSQRYTVEDRVKGRRLVAKVTYTDGHGPGQAVSDTTAAVRANVPGPPGDLQAEVGDEQVELTWTAAAAHGSAIDRYELRYRSESSWTGRDSSAVPGGGSARDTTVTGLTNGTEYVFQVWAHNAEGYGRADSVRATPQGNRGNRPPVITAPDTVWFAEHRTDSVATLSATDPEDDAVTWSHTGADVDRYEVRGDTLYFKMTPDFEAPATRTRTTSTR